MSVYQIPLSPGVAQGFVAPLAGGVAYNFRVFYVDAPDGDGGWMMDISDSLGNPLLAGVPLVTGADLLAQYAYLGIGGTIYVITDGDPSAPPTFQNLGVNSHLAYEV